MTQNEGSTAGGTAEEELIRRLVAGLLGPTTRARGRFILLQFAEALDAKCGATLVVVASDKGPMEFSYSVGADLARAS